MIKTINDLTPQCDSDVKLINKAKKKGIDIGVKIKYGTLIGVIGNLYFGSNENGTRILKGYFSFNGGSMSCINVNDDDVNIIQIHEQLKFVI